MNPVRDPISSLTTCALTFDGWLEFINLICSFSYECGSEAYIDNLPLSFGMTLEHDEPQCLLAWELGWIDECEKDQMKGVN